MRLVLGTLATALLSLLLTMGAAAAATTAPGPSCAAGPMTVGGTIYGTPCADVIVAPPGVETVRGGGGDDTIVAAPLASASCPSGCELGVGSQTFEGGPGDDIVYGQRGNDTLLGGAGNDQLFGGIGDDVMRGGPGNDRLAGGFGADAIDGEAGDDYVHGDGTIDRIDDSGGGSDTLSYATGITPGFGAGIDTGQAGFPPAAEGRGLFLALSAGGQNANNGVAPFGGGVDEVTTAGFETVIGTPFSDFIVGTSGPQTIYGGGGADVIRGEGGGDTLDGGADGDYVDGGSVVQRDTTKVSVGLMAPGVAPWSQLYLTGSNGKDGITATYAGGSVSFALTFGAFDQSASAASGCTVTATQATCPLATPLDSIVLAGMGGNDTINASNFPRSTTVVILGGEGGDSLNGGPESEDVLVDGPDNEGAFGDVLSALGGDDALLHNGGADQLFGGDGNDLFLSNSVCDGTLLNGGADRDNASWARFDEGVEANLGSGRAGRPGVGDVPDCGGAGLDSLGEIEDLEGSSSRDRFYGDSGPNQLLGHLGPDDYFAGAGSDTILANSGDDDPAIDCGDDIDRALIDRHPEYNDAAPVNCEVVREADPNSFQILPGFPLPTPPPTAAPAPVTPKSPPRDRVSPRTKILTHPRAQLITAKARRRVVFRFDSNESGSRFRCKLDAKPYVACTSPHAYSLALGRHAVRIVAIDRAGNADPTPALFKLHVRRR